MLELKLFSSLDEAQQWSAAVIETGVYPELRQLPPEQRNDEEVKWQLRYLHSRHKEAVVTAVREQEVVGVYVMSPFLLQRRKHTLANSFFGSYIITEPRREGIATAILGRLEPVLEALGHAAAVTGVFHRDRYREGGMLFSNLSYTDAGMTKEGNRRYERLYKARPHMLAEPQQRIVEAFLAVLH